MDLKPEDVIRILYSLLTCGDECTEENCVELAAVKEVERLLREE